MKQISPISPIIPRGTAGFTGPLSLLRSRGTARALRALGGGGGRYKGRMDIDSWEISLWWIQKAILLLEFCWN